MTGGGASAARVSRSVRWDLVNESFREADFLWRHRQRALVATDRDVHDVARSVDERLLGCFDGLRVGGDAAVDRLLRPALRSAEVTQISVAAHALAVDGGRTASAVLLAGLSDADETRAAAMARGLGLVERADLLPLLERVARSERPEALASLCEVQSSRQLPAGPRAPELMASGHPRLLLAVVRSARHGEQGAADPVIAIGLEQSEGVRDAALESGLILGNGAAAARCSELVSRLPQGSGHVLLLAALARPDEERRGLLAALSHEHLASAAVWALGFAGTRWAADACLDLMRENRHMFLAHEAFQSITGWGHGNGPVATGAGPWQQRTVNEDDFALAPSDVTAMNHWWSGRRKSHEAGVRCVHGRPISEAVLAHALLTEPMRRRHALALALAVRSKARRQLDTRAWCRRQRQETRRWLAADSSAQV
jgi:uncharacterized protein (TIGR02270 family)